MENTSPIETLLESATDYGKISLKLLKLKTLDQASTVFSTLITHAVVYILISSFILFISLGLALWLGELVGKIYFGFFMVAGIYGLIACIVSFFLQGKVRQLVSNYTIKQVLN